MIYYMYNYILEEILIFGGNSYMKKRLFALMLAVILVISLLFSFAGCESNGGYTEKYAYSHCYADYSITEEYVTFDETLEFIYSDTYLKLYDDGTWIIDTPVFLSSSMNIDEGTYEFDGDEYVFHGFEYGMKSVGYKSGDEFIIKFLVPNGYGYITAMSITYEK